MRKTRKYQRNVELTKQIENDFSMSEMFEQFMFIKKTEGLAKRTIEEYYVNFNYLLDYTEGDLTSNQMTTELFCSWIDFMQEEMNLAPATINIRVRTTRAFVKYAYEEKGWINQPIHKRFKPIKSPIDVVESLTDEEVKRLIGACDDGSYVGYRTQVICYTLLDSLIRVSELVNLRKEDVNLNEGTVYVKADTTKTRTGRFVPISTKTIKVLRAYLLETEEFDNEYFFLSYEGKPLTKNTIRTDLSVYGKVAKINNRVSPHVFRHTGALFYIRNGGDPFSLQKILGHSHMNMVRRYIQMTDRDIQYKHNQYSPIANLFK
ncbi:tyrosine-type recombinase/integrase [Piscibacillus salipiscarius]|uniref:Tyrosine-type recombinase/integrase n=1 Tax=Piscibacillus salipiscarius TaxID=299480 RepID=A0ABW5Q9X4_9BACI|nr:tyrosine-type recombinase/integrase [Piscibacillus salipiscarius]